MNERTAGEFFPSEREFFDFIDMCRRERDAGAEWIDVFGSLVRREFRSGVSDIDIASDAHSEGYDNAEGLRSEVFFEVFRRSKVYPKGTWEPFEMDPKYPSRRIILKRG